MRYMPWIIGAVALWLMAAPFILGYATMTPAMWNDIAVGVVMLFSAALWGYHESWTSKHQSQR